MNERQLRLIAESGEQLAGDSATAREMLEWVTRYLEVEFNFLMHARLQVQAIIRSLREFSDCWSPEELEARAIALEEALSARIDNALSSTTEDTPEQEAIEP